MDAHSRMIRTQVRLTVEQSRTLKRLAIQRGVSVAELIRQGVDRVIAESERRGARRRALAMLGRYRGGAPDVSVNHDRYLDEAYGNDGKSSKALT